MKQLTTRSFLLALLAFVLSIPAFSAPLPRAEYPRPQLVRDAWQNLNGTWTYEFDFSLSGLNRGLQRSQGFSNQITVPFCPESKLSGVEYKDFIAGMWYHRTIRRPAEWAGKRVRLNFGAVDYFCAIYIDGELIGHHWGGSSSFSFDITDAIADGAEHHLVVRVEDATRSNEQTTGKQAHDFASSGCMYTRVTGIWQTVWMEAVSPFGLKNVYIIPELDEKRFVVQPQFFALQAGQTLEVIVRDGKKIVGRAKQRAATPMNVVLPLKSVKTWSPEDPFLYDIELNVCAADGTVLDHVTSYAGMRKIHIEGNRLYLNNKPLYLRTVLDQGYYPTGVWTAPSDGDLRRDVELGLKAGFNGARLHQKVFEERYLYWADRLGYLVSAESASWGMNMQSQISARNFLTEWEEIVVRDRNHPSIIMWTPYNETWGRSKEREAARQHDRFVGDVYTLTHNLDYRPVDDVSGGNHVVADIWSLHNYSQTGKELAEVLTWKDGKAPQFNENEARYGGQPYFLDEYGGIKWVVGQQYAENTWGYGQGPKTLEELYTRLEELTRTIISFDYICGFCYTQLTDVEQEQNGVYNFDRSEKFDMQRVSSIFRLQPEEYNK
ncbi:MAG: beta-glucuronidase [Bacteroidaceae bacterium]|nr:beta-glucuronidase [Bacteroidaceae bacterium]